MRVWGLTFLKGMRQASLFLIIEFNKMKDYKNYFILTAEPKDIYNAITNETMLEIWTGEPATMKEVPGSEFSLWDGSIVGKNIEFIKDKKIVQQWYFEGEEIESVVMLNLHFHKKGTSVELVHTNIPEDAYENIKLGWETEYFAALSELFEG